MKRGIILVLTILLLLPAASATLIINGPQIEKYNIGDQISISGYAQQEQAVTGFLQFSMVCGDSTYPLQMVPITLSANQQETFPGDISIPDFMASMSMQGQCKIRAELTSGSALVDFGESSPFEVTKEIEGTFDVLEPRVQVGSDVAISGELSKLDGTRLEGAAEIYFRRNDTKYLVTVQNFKDGTLSYTHKTSAIPEGRYFIDILARDTFGNEKLFEDAANFVLIKQLSVTGDIDKEEYLPGETVVISGSAKNVLQDPVPTAEAMISVGEKSYKTTVTDGKFEGSFQIPQNMKSGKHAILISVNDDLGNSGSAKLRMSVEAVPSKINIRLNNNEFLPKDIIELTGTLYDQASDAMSGDLQLEVYDPDEDLVLTKKVSSTKKEAFSFPEFAKPGKWAIKILYEELEQSEEVTVNEHLSLGVLLDKTALKIKNLGNIKFNDDIRIEAIGEKNTYKIDKSSRIRQNNTETIDLSSQLPTGMYVVNVKTPSGQHQFSNVRIADGKSWQSFNMAYLMLVMASVGLLVYMAYSKVRLPTGRHKFAAPKPFKMRDLEPKAETKKFSILNIGKDKESEMAEYKARILNDVRKAEISEAKRQNGHTFVRPEKKQEGNSLFSMFD